MVQDKITQFYCVNFIKYNGFSCMKYYNEGEHRNQENE